MDVYGHLEKIRYESAAIQQQRAMITHTHFGHIAFGCYFVSSHSAIKAQTCTSGNPTCFDPDNF